MNIELKEGEIYVGRINDEHIILLPGDNDNDTREAQLEWAKSIGGDLPTRIEQAMLWANHRDQFKKDWYWSNEIHHAESSWAWYQFFDNGYQNNNYRYFELRARAVRRIKVEGRGAKDMNIEQIAYEQASGEMLDYFSKEQLAAFLHRCLSKLADQAGEPLGSERYRVEKRQSGFWPYRVVAGTGTMEIFIGHQKQCTKVANALAAAFEDGKFAAQQKVAEACARYCAQTLSPSKTIPNDSGRAWIAGTLHCADGIRNGEWREYL